MKKIFNLIFSAAFVLLLLTACGGPNVNKEELAKIPENFPQENAPIYNIAEFISYTDNTMAGQYSAEIVYNTYADYDSVVEYYKEYFPNAICTDFGIAYNVLNVMPAGEGHLVSVRIYSSINQGESGACTITISALEQ
ncbi:MAG: hypothetical protein IJP09_02680 [Clostridia bacterium]|nr:hypothetical protein [Clostridia bacterium]